MKRNCRVRIGGPGVIMVYSNYHSFWGRLQALFREAYWIWLMVQIQWSRSPLFFSASWINCITTQRAPVLTGGRELQCHNVCPLQSASYPWSLFLEQQIQLSKADNVSDIASLPKKIGKMANMEVGQKGQITLVEKNKCKGKVVGMLCLKRVLQELQLIMVHVLSHLLAFVALLNCAVATVPIVVSINTLK